MAVRESPILPEGRKKINGWIRTKLLVKLSFLPICYAEGSWDRKQTVRSCGILNLLLAEGGYSFYIEWLYPLMDRFCRSFLRCEQFPHLGFSTQVGYHHFSFGLQVVLWFIRAFLLIQILSIVGNCIFTKAVKEFRGSPSGIYTCRSGAVKRDRIWQNILLAKAVGVFTGFIWRQENHFSIIAVTEIQPIPVLCGNGLG